LCALAPEEKIITGSTAALHAMILIRLPLQVEVTFRRMSRTRGFSSGADGGWFFGDLPSLGEAVFANLANRAHKGGRRFSTSFFPLDYGSRVRYFSAF